MPGTSGMINVSIKGGAFLMSTNKLTIVPVKLDLLQTEISSLDSPPDIAAPAYV